MLRIAICLVLVCFDVCCLSLVDRGMHLSTDLQSNIVLLLPRHLGSKLAYSVCIRRFVLLFVSCPCTSLMCVVLLCIFSSDDFAYIFSLIVSHPKFGCSFDINKSHATVLFLLDNNAPFFLSPILFGVPMANAMLCLSITHTWFLTSLQRVSHGQTLCYNKPRSTSPSFDTSYTSQRNCIHSSSCLISRSNHE